MIIVVGGRGFIGGGIVAALSASGQEVVVMTHDPVQGKMPGFRHGDMLRPETLRGAFDGAEAVVQSAMFSTYPIEKPRRGHLFMRYDGEGTENLVAAARAAGVHRYLYIAGSGIPADGQKIYFQAILRGEQAVQNSGMEAVCLRPTLVFGPQDRGLNTILAFARRTPVLPVVGSGRQMEQPVFLGDVGAAASALIRLGAPQGVFQIGGPERFTLEEMLQRLFRLAGLQRTILHVPPALARFGAAILEKLPGELLTRNVIDFLQENFVADTTRLLATVDLRLTPFEEGLRSYLDLPPSTAPPPSRI